MFHYVEGSRSNTIITVIITENFPNFIAGVTDAVSFSTLICTAV